MMVKEYFVDEVPAEAVKKTVMGYVYAHQKRSLIARYKHRYVAVPVFLFMIFWSYMVFFASSPLDKEITQTQTAMQQLITMVDTEVF